MSGNREVVLFDVKYIAKLCAHDIVLHAPCICRNKTVILREPIDYIDEDYARQKLESFPDDISCWICLEEKDLSSASRPLLRDCCCRGDHQGWAHYECLAQ